MPVDELGAMEGIQKELEDNDEANYHPQQDLMFFFKSSNAIVCQAFRGWRQSTIKCGV
jgi:hypothetical protein